MHVYTYNANLPYYIVSRPTMSKRHSLDLKRLQEGHFCGQIWWSAFAVVYRRTDNPTGKIRQELHRLKPHRIPKEKLPRAGTECTCHRMKSTSQVLVFRPDWAMQTRASWQRSCQTFVVLTSLSCVQWLCTSMENWKITRNPRIAEFSRCCFHSLWQALLTNIREYLIWTGKGTWVSGKSEIQLVDSIGERELFCISTSCHRSQTCSDHVQQCQFLESYLWSTLSLPSLLRSSSAGTKDQVVRPASSTVFGLIKSYHILSYHTVLYYLIIPYLNISQ